MSYAGRERRRQSSPEPRRSFGLLATEALRARIRDTRVDGAHWLTSNNLVWVRWTPEEGGFRFCALRRSQDYLTGEMGVSPVPVELEDMPLIEALHQAMPAGCRIRLGHVLHGHDRWWSAGGSETSLIWRLDWLANHLRLRLMAFVAAAAPPH